MNCTGISVLPSSVTLAVHVPTNVNHASSNKNTSFHILLLFSTENVIQIQGVSWRSQWVQTFITRKPKDLQPQENHKSFFWQIDMFDVCTTGDTGHTDTIFKFLPHVSTWVHRYSSLLQWSVPLGQQGHVANLGWIPCLWHILKEENHRA